MKKRIVGLLGGPEQVAGSLSPTIFKAAFDKPSGDWRYFGFPTTRSQLRATLSSLVRAGVVGVNVTTPFKQSVVDLCKSLDATASSAGAVNTIHVDSSVKGFNTDGSGFVEFLRDDLGLDAAGLRVVILGTGGAARAITVALADAGAGSVSLVSRNPTAHMELRHLSANTPVSVVGSEEAEIAQAQVIVNATGVSPKLSGLSPAQIVVDLRYGPPPQRFLESAASLGCKAVSGLGMLLRQAAGSYEIWTGEPAPLSEMKSALSHLDLGL